MENRNPNWNASSDITAFRKQRNLSDISSQANQSIEQLFEAKTGESEELAQLLAMLQDAIEHDPILTLDQMQQALSAVSMLAIEGGKPAEQRTVNYCTMAVHRLKKLATSLPNTSKVANAVSTLLPMLISIFGL